MHEATGDVASGQTCRVITQKLQFYLSRFKTQQRSSDTVDPNRGYGEREGRTHGEEGRRGGRGRRGPGGGRRRGRGSGGRRRGRRRRQGRRRRGASGVGGGAGGVGAGSVEGRGRRAGR